MRIFITLSFLCLTSLTLLACSTMPTSFPNEKIMEVHQGMGSEEILTMFGEPKNIRVAVCGMPPSTWNCTTWEYDVFPEGYAYFRFSGEHDALVLNDFNVDRDW